MAEVDLLMKTYVYANEKQSSQETYFASLLGPQPSSESGLPFDNYHMGLAAIASTLVLRCGYWFFYLIPLCLSGFSLERLF